MVFDEERQSSVDALCPLPTYESVEAEVAHQLASPKSREELTRLLTEFILTSIYEVALPRLQAEPVSARVAGNKIEQAPLE